MQARVSKPREPIRQWRAQICRTATNELPSCIAVIGLWGTWVSRWRQPLPSTCLQEASFLIVAVPTPIDRAKRPDLGPLIPDVIMAGRSIQFICGMAGIARSDGRSALEDVPTFPPRRNRRNRRNDAIDSMNLFEKFRHRTATVGVIGLGYVGLPFAEEHGSERVRSAGN